MGQQIALQQKCEENQDSQTFSSRCESVSNDGEYVPKQGVLKISINPFPYSKRIGSTINGLPIYAERSRSLQQQKIKRRKQSLFFSQYQILDLIESTVYTLASLQQQNIIYKNICSENIFLTRTNQRNESSSSVHFKLFPNPLLQQSTYEKLLNFKKIGQSDKNYSLSFSPEMIIAFRARQKCFTDPIFLKKSNVFSLGMVILQAATLNGSQQFYDLSTLDIFEESIEKRLVQIQSRYGPIVAKIIANMIDFDFEERIEGFSELAKWIIFQLQEQKNERQNFKSNQTYDQNLRAQQSPPKSLIHINFNKNSQSLLNQQKIQMMPICHKKNDEPEKINIKSKLTLKDSQVQKENQSTQNKIKIKIREVPVYLQKNSRLKNDKQNKSRLIHSPFANSNKSKNLSEYSSYQRAQIQIMGHTKRSLAFDETKNSQRKFLNEINVKNKICRIQR